VTSSGSTSSLFQKRAEDQAEELRRLAASRRDDVSRRIATSTRVIAVTSGKGGVGKTSLTVNLAVTLQRWGKQVIILDCDLGTANVDVMLGMHPRYSLQHVLSRQRSLDEVMTTGPHGVRIISGGSGLQELANLSDGRREELLATFAALEGQADILLLDTGAGISANVLRFVIAAGEAIIVTTPEPTAVTDAYALIKVVSQQARVGSYALHGSANGHANHAGNEVQAGYAVAPHDGASDLRLRLVVNQAINETEARETATNIATVARRFLNVDVEAFGAIPLDRSISQAVRAQSAVVDSFPRSPAALAIQSVAERLLHGTARAVGDTSPLMTVAEAQGADQEAFPPRAAAQSGTAVAGGNDRGAGGRKGFGMFVQRMFGSTRGRAVGP
jgi:flagellar biosynthesis protein FlhG